MVLKPKTRGDFLIIPKLIADQYPVVTGTTCVEIRIPDSIEYLYSVQGFLGLLCNQWAFRGARVDREARASLWLQAYTETDWGQCMNCEELTACITPLLEAQTEAINRLLAQSKYGTDEIPGQPMTDAEKERNLAGESNPTCDKDVLWAQCVQVIDYMDTLIIDALEAAEAATNGLELVDILSGFPGIDELGADVIAGYAAALQDGIAENYVAAVTAEYKEAAACELFCLAVSDCVITADMIYQVFYDRNVAAFGSPIEAITTIGDLLSYMVDQNVSGTTVADFMMLLIAGGGVLAAVFLGDVGTKTLSAILALAVDDASSDWEILCTECSTCIIQYDYNNQASFTPVSGNTATLDATGWYLSGAYPAGGGNPQWVLLESTETPTGVTALKLRVDISDNDSLNVGFVIDTGGGTSTVAPTGFSDNGVIRTYYYDFMTPTDLDYLGYNVNSTVDVQFRVIAASLCD